jgi:hypothetical protein
MTEEEARLILQCYRPGDLDRDDSHFAEALREVEKNPAMARWFEEEQAFDRAIAAHLKELPAPFGLKTRILAEANPSTATPGPRRWSLVTALAAVAALLFLCAQVVSLFRPSPPAQSGTMPDYVREMVSFIRLDPPLEMASHDLEAIKGWLGQAGFVSRVPPRLAALDPLGCRILSFRGHNVELICFQRGPGRLAHLFVVDRDALPKMEPGEKPIFTSAGEWMTACWSDGDKLYMIAVQGDRAAVEAYLPRA